MKREAYLVLRILYFVGEATKTWRREGTEDSEKKKSEIRSTKSETNSKCECSNDQNRDRGGRGFRIAYLAEKRILEKKGRVVNQKNHKELRGFSIGPLCLDLPK